MIYAGVWYEQARTPTALTRGCDDATTAYARDTKDRILVRDACRQDGPAGAERAIEGVGEIADPGVNATLRVRYRFGPGPVSNTLAVERTMVVAIPPGEVAHAPAGTDAVRTQSRPFSVRPCPGLARVWCGRRQLAVSRVR